MPEPGYETIGLTDFLQANAMGDAGQPEDVSNYYMETGRPASSNWQAYQDWNLQRQLGGRTPQQAFGGENRQVSADGKSIDVLSSTLGKNIKQGFGSEELMLALFSAAVGGAGAWAGGAAGGAAAGASEAASLTGSGGFGAGGFGGGAEAFASGASGLSGIPEDLGYDFMPGQGFNSPLRGIPEDIGFDFGPQGFGPDRGNFPNIPGGSNIGEFSNRAPVEERTLNPARSGGVTPDFGNLVAGISKSGGLGNFMSTSTGGLPWNMIKSSFDVGSGLYGLMQKKRMADMAKMAFDRYNAMGDPDAQAKALMANPGSITGMPGYQFGMDEGRRAIARTGAASGSGGNEAIAAARYTPEYAQNFYNNEVARLMQLGQGEAQVGQGNASLAFNAENANRNATSQSLASIGYGVNRMSGGPDYNSVIQRLLTRA